MLKPLGVYSSKARLAGIVVKIENESDFYEWQQRLGGYVRL